MLSSLFPAPEMYLPESGEPPLRWGILAPGHIAAAFAGALRDHTAQRVVAVGSRSADRASAFGDRFGIERAHGSYEALVGDDGVDVVYVAAPASQHLELGLLAIAAGKHVLIEKPLATDATDARLLADAARAGGTFVMEALWSRYLPQASVIRRLLADGVIGAPRGVIADLSQAIPEDPDHRLRRPELGGGALLDLGIYPIQLDRSVMGAPTSVTAVGGMTDTGVDAFATLVLGHGAQAQSTLTTSILARAGGGASILGSEGRIDLAGPHHIPTTLTLRGTTLAGPSATWTDPTGIARYGGLSWQANALARFVGEGRSESPVHGLDESVAVLEVIDEARRQLQR
jgi:predicted dehydrogenase